MKTETHPSFETDASLTIPAFRAPQGLIARRGFGFMVAAAGLGGLGVLGLGGPAFAGGTGSPDAGLTRRASRQRDIDIQNFGLNFEYLGAEYYLRATGNPNGLAGLTDGTGTPGDVTGGVAVPFATPDVAAFARELAFDERGHVIALRSGVGAARIARPQIDLANSFTAMAVAAGIIPAGGTFDAFANEVNFLIGGFVLEDVCVTFLKGGAPLLLDPAVVEAAAGLLGTEGYHAGAIRTMLYARRDLVAVPASGGRPAVTVAEAVQRISDLRDLLDGAGDADQGIVLKGQANLTPTDANALAFSRTPRQVLNIAYGQPGTPANGGFFPAGVNGTIS